jgi:hypothetical protein
VEIHVVLKTDMNLFLPVGKTTQNTVPKDLAAGNASFQLEAMMKVRHLPVNKQRQTSQLTVGIKFGGGAVNHFVGMRKAEAGGQPGLIDLNPATVSLWRPLADPLGVALFGEQLEE